MVVRNRTAIPRANVRGALLLGALLAAIIAVAIGIAFRIYVQLDNEAAVQQALVASQQELDDVVFIQLNLETSLRGYLASGATLFLQPFETGNDHYTESITAFERT